MPVEDIELAHLHQVEVVPDHGLGNVVSACVHQNSSVCESWRVHYLGSVDNILQILDIRHVYTRIKTFILLRRTLDAIMMMIMITFIRMTLTMISLILMTTMMMIFLTNT